MKIKNHKFSIIGQRRRRRRRRWWWLKMNGIEWLLSFTFDYFFLFKKLKQGTNIHMIFDVDDDEWSEWSWRKNKPKWNPDLMDKHIFNLCKSLIYADIQTHLTCSFFIGRFTFVFDDCCCWSTSRKKQWLNFSSVKKNPKIDVEHFRHADRLHIH